MKKIDTLLQQFRRFKREEQEDMENADALSKSIWEFEKAWNLSELDAEIKKAKTAPPEYIYFTDVDGQHHEMEWADLAWYVMGHHAPWNRLDCVSSAEAQRILEQIEPWKNRGTTGRTLYAAVKAQAQEEVTPCLNENQ